MKRSIILICICAIAQMWASRIALADPRLPAVISDHMILQSGVAVPIWGWADPSEQITVSIGDHSQSAKADSDGKWTAKLDPLKASDKPQTLLVKGKITLTVNDVLIGEVWLASGQSNMEMQLRGLHGAIDRADEEIATATYPQIRMFICNHPFSIYELPAPPDKPQTDIDGQWWVCSPQTVAHFSAIGYFFARTLNRELSVPVGILDAAVGGTPIEAWTSLEAQQADLQLKPVLDDWQKRLTNYDPTADLAKFNEAKKIWLKERAAAKAANQPAPKAPAAFKNLRVTAPAGLFNGVIAPLIPYAVRGVIWYQGERNAAGPLTGLYGRQLATLIADWRQRWNDDLYFAWVQLPRFQKEQRFPSEPNGWGVAVRDEMRKTLSVPHTAMAITIDLGGEKAGHPTNKADFAQRLSLLALHDVYTKPIAIWSGPLFRSATRDGNKMALTFDHADGLKAASGELTGFVIAGDDQKFVWADAKIVNDQVIVSSDRVKEPAAVRYGWAGNPKCNLVNAAGLPASPFRTDDWK